MNYNKIDKKKERNEKTILFRSLKLVSKCYCEILKKRQFINLVEYV